MFTVGKYFYFNIYLEVLETPRSIFQRYNKCTFYVVYNAKPPYTVFFKIRFKSHF